MAKTKSKTLAPAARRNKKTITQTKSVPRAKSAHAHLQRVYQENGFVGSSDHSRMDFPVSRYRNHPGLIVTAIVLAVALVGALGYICFPLAASWHQADNSESASEPSTTDNTAAAADQSGNTPDAAAPAPETPADPAAGWLSYSDTNGAFEFKYAPAWQADQQDPQIINFALSEAADTVISANWQATGTSLNAYLTALDKANAKGWEGQPSVKIERQGNVKIGTLNAYQRWQKLLAADLEQIMTYIPVGNKIYALSIRSPKLDDQIIQTYGLFLATFKINGISSTPALASTTPKIK